MEQVIEDSQRPAEPCLSGLERYQLVQKLEQEHGRSQWYATLRHRPEGPDREAPETAVSYEAKIRKRAETERLLCIFAPPKGDVDTLAESATSWAERVSSQRLTMRHPHLMHTHDVSATDPLCPFSALEFPEGGSLARLLAAHEKLIPSQCAHVVLGVGRALGWLHGQGNAHGTVRPSEVHFSRSGVALLKPAWGQPWGLPEGVASTRAEDVRAFAEMTWRMLVGKSPGPRATRFPLPMLCPTATQPVVEVLEAALDEDVASRPEIHEIVLAVGGAWDPCIPDLNHSAYPDFASRVPAMRESPRRADGNIRGRVEQLRAVARRSGDGRRLAAGRLRAAPPADRPSMSEPWRTQRSYGRFPASKRTVVVAGAIALAAGGATAGARWWSEAHREAGGMGAGVEARPTPEAAPPHPEAPEVHRENWEGVVKALFASRDQALRDRDEDHIGDYAEKGGLDRQDRALIQQLKATNTRWDRLESLLTAVRVETLEEEHATVEARIRVTGWDPAAHEGAETAAGHDKAGGSSQRIRIGLGRTTGSWKITEVTPLDE